MKKKMITADLLKYNKIPKLAKIYSSPKIEGLELNKGARPCPVDQLEFGTYSTKGYNILKNSSFSYKKPTIIIEDYSDICAKIVFHKKHTGFGTGTIINDSAFDQLKEFYDFLEKHDKLCSDINDLLSKNPFFPLEVEVLA